MKTYLLTFAPTEIIQHASRKITFLCFSLSLSYVAFSAPASGKDLVFNSNTNYTYKSVDTVGGGEFSLPLVMTSFIATVNDKQVQLTWVTGMEKKLSKFIVERSINGRDYTEAGIVQATGTSGVKQTYTFTDPVGSSSKSTILYYRLQMIDETNRHQNSEVRIIRIEDVNSGLKLMVYPNPASEEVKITIPASWQERQVNYAVYNTNGLMVKYVNDKAAGQTEVVNLKDLVSGIYVVKASSGTETATQRIVKR
jgi:type IX secretion system substrate protein